MTSHNEEPKQAQEDLRDIFTEQRSMELVDRAMNDDRDEPDNFIRMLLLLYDHSNDTATQAAIMNLIRAAYSRSLAHSNTLNTYLDSLRGGESR
ncbi:MAG TPA: hypothetical protein VLR90_07755 [Blastocatellia bacterium]|nr:hypothetical protein [Blastocatellia bacterium]